MHAWSMEITFKDVVALNLSDFKTFNKSNTRLDDFFFKKMKMKDYPKLADVAKLILCIGHGQAAVERGFNVTNKYILQTNMQEKGLISQSHDIQLYDIKRFEASNSSYDKRVSKIH